jgi:hypothetical protein
MHTPPHRVSTLVLLAAGCLAWQMPTHLARMGTAMAQEGRQAGKVDLRPKFKKGAESSFSMDLDITGTQKLPEVGDVKTVITQNIGLKLIVREVAANGSATVDMVYESLKLKSTSPLMEMSFDSSKPATVADSIDALLRPIIGLTLTMQTDEKGNITSVSTTGGAGVPGDLLKQFTGSEIVKGLFGPILNISSGSGLASVGEKWTNEDSMQGAMGTMKIKNVFTLSSYREPSATMDISGTITLDASSNGPATIREGTTRGTAVWDTEVGMLKSLELTQKLSVATTLAGQESLSTQDMKVNVTRK